MFNSEYISEQLQEARRRDLLELAERSRLAAEVRAPRRLTLPRVQWRWHRRAPVVEPTPVVEPRPCGQPATR